MFLEEIEKVARISKPIFKQKTVKIFSHFDADGIVSAAIIMKMFLREKIPFQLRILKQLTNDKIDELNIDQNDFVIFTDFGSGQLNAVKRFLDITHVLILDHHEPERFENINLFHLNPLLYAEEEISSSMISYIFAKNVNKNNTDLIDLAIVGAVADVQDEKWELKGLARKILGEAELMGKISTMKGLRLYGRTNRPIHKSLEYSFDPHIPGISGFESHAIQFLSDLGIPVKDNGEWRKLKDLSLEEQQKLATAIIVERLKVQNLDAVDIFGEIYTLIGKPEELQDVREFSTLINACGRLGNYGIALRLCMDDFSALNAAWDSLDQYRKLISESINWVRNNKNAILNTENASFIFYENKVPDILAGTITSILLNSNLVSTDKPIFGFAETEDNNLKVSARSLKDLKEINLRDIIVQAVKIVNGEAGGHKHAAGALIAKSKQHEFVQALDKKLGEINGFKES